MQSEQYAEAATLRDQITQHPDNVSTSGRAELQTELEKALQDEDYEVQPARLHLLLALSDDAPHRQCPQACPHFTILF